VTRTPYVSKVYFQYDLVLQKPLVDSEHSSSPKLIPWFVSDVTPLDFEATLESLLNPAFFPQPTENDKTIFTKGLEDLIHMVSRWKEYIRKGIFILSIPDHTPLGGNKQSKLAEFWTGPRPYWDIKKLAPELFAHLSSSDLVVFKVCRIISVRILTIV
jgi:damage-control phosphatase, subfamily III